MTNQLPLADSGVKPVLRGLWNGFKALAVALWHGPEGDSSRRLACPPPPPGHRLQRQLPAGDGHFRDRPHSRHPAPERPAGPDPAAPRPGLMEPGTNAEHSRR